MDFSDERPHDPRTPSTWRARRRALRGFLGANHGLITTRELEELGIKGATITRLIGDRELVRECRGVYRGCGTPQTADAQLRADLLRAGPRAALDRRSGAYALGLLRYPHDCTQVAIPGTSGFRKDGRIERHAAFDVGESDVVLAGDLRSLSPFRLILRLAADVAEGKRGSLPVFRWAIRSAANEDHSLAARLRGRVDERAPFPGSAVLTAELGPQFENTVEVRSNVEVRFVDLCRRYGIPLPVTNAVVHGLELDAYWVEHDAFVELDTFETHGDPLSFERDRSKFGQLARHGLRGLAITDRRIDAEPDGVAADVLGHLGLSRSSGGAQK